MKNDIKSLTLDEKLKLLTGKDCWRTHDFGGKLDSIFVSDGPCGLRKMEDVKGNGEYETVKSTSYPCVHVLANSWNKDLVKKIAACMADDCIEHNVDVLLAPGVNVKRHPLNGRNFEYFSEDPYLAGTLAKEYIDGLQEKGVGTSLKHYTANNLEQDRTLVSSEVDERTLREIYLKPFEIALKAKPTTVMCSYNKINGVYASEHIKLMKTLREELGFNGLIVSDWHAVHDRVKSLKATVDLEMPNREESFYELKSAYERGEITIEEIDYCVGNILNLINKINQMKPLRKITATAEQRHEIAREGVGEGAVLLKNQGALPLRPKAKIAVFGMRGDRIPTTGDGSARVQSDYPIKTLGEELKTAMPEADICDMEAWTLWQGQSEHFHLGAKLQKAYDADVAIVIAGNDYKTEGEGFDRQSIKLQPRVEQLINEVAAVNENTVVVLCSGSAVDTSAWDENVNAILYMGFAGEASMQGASDILSGRVCPSGKLSETFAYNLEEYTTSKRIGSALVNWYQEGIFVGYRYFDTFMSQVAYPFGHGLSYADFEYSDLKVEKVGDFEVELSYKIKNLSEIPAKEISQVYVKDVFSSVVRPEKELKAYSKDLIEPGQAKEIKIKLDKSAFSYYSVAVDGWVAEKGSFEIEVASSSKDTRLRRRIDL